MTYSDKVRAEVAARYGVPVRCPVQIIPQGVIAMPPGLGATIPISEMVGQQGRNTTARSAGHRKTFELRDGGQRFQEAAHRFSRSLSDIRALKG